MVKHTTLILSLLCSSSQIIRSSDLFKRLHIKRARETDVIDGDAQKTRAENIAHCGISCSMDETCFGLQYSSETKACRKIIKVTLCISDRIFPTLTQSSSSCRVSPLTCWRRTARSLLRSSGGPVSLRPVLNWVNWGSS